jgi:hypothetical protein
MSGTSELHVQAVLCLAATSISRYAHDEPQGGLADTATLAVAALVKELNELLTPIIHRLETAPTRD